MKSWKVEAKNKVGRRRSADRRRPTLLITSIGILVLAVVLILMPNILGSLCSWVSQKPMVKKIAESKAYKTAELHYSTAKNTFKNTASAANKSIGTIHSKVSKSKPVSTLFSRIAALRNLLSKRFHNLSFPNIRKITSCLCSYFERLVNAIKKAVKGK